MSKPNSEPRLKEIDLTSMLSEIEAKFRFLKPKPFTRHSENRSSESKTG